LGREEGIIGPSLLGGKEEGIKSCKKCGEGCGFRGVKFHTSTISFAVKKGIRGQGTSKKISTSTGVTKKRA